MIATDCMVNGICIVQMHAVCMWLQLAVPLCVSQGSVGVSLRTYTTCPASHSDSYVCSASISSLALRLIKLIFLHSYQHSTTEGSLSTYYSTQYAADWKVIGTLLGLPSGELNSIEAGYPTNVKWCCNQMLEEWLEVDSSASWNKLLSVIQSPAVSSDQATAKGDKLL